MASPRPRSSAARSNTAIASGEPALNFSWTSMTVAAGPQSEGNIMPASRAIPSPLPNPSSEPALPYASRPVFRDADVPDFSRHVARPPVELPVQDQPGAEPGSHCHEDDVPEPLARAEIPLRERSGVAVVLDEHRELEFVASICLSGISVHPGRLGGDLTDPVRDVERAADRNAHAREAAPARRSSDRRMQPRRSSETGSEPAAGLGRELLPRGYSPAGPRPRRRSLSRRCPGR